MNIHRRIRREYASHQRRKGWQNFVRTLAMIVVFCTTYALILPAITMVSEADCGIDEHTHSEACYAPVTESTLPQSQGHTHQASCRADTRTLTCTQEEIPPHAHGESCCTRTVVCGQEEQAAHSHSDSCLGTLETLICTETAPEHQHVATCWVYETGLVCGLEEAEGHSHSDSCFLTELSCALEETEGHLHGDGCYAVISELVCGLEESHAAEPEMVLICGMQEHVHDESCYPLPEATLPTSDPTADVETEADWQLSLSAAELTGDWSEDLLAVARTQLGYEESADNYILDENGKVFRYTRYGQWYGEPYGDWSAMFVSFCLHYAGVEGIDPARNCQEWLDTAELYREAELYTPVPGDLIFFDRDGDGSCDHVGIAESITPATDSEATAVNVIAGDHNGQVALYAVSLEDASILGFCVLPTEPKFVIYASANGDGPQVQAALPEDTAVPADAALTVTAVTEEDEQYAAMAEQIRQSVTDTVRQMTLLDISFYDAAGEYLSVSDTAQVSICFTEAAFGGGEVKVFHFVDGTPVELENVSVSYTATAAEEETGAVQTQLSFETEGFSVFAVVEVIDTSDRVTVLDPAELAGNSYYIVSNNQNYIMIDSIHANGNGLAWANYTGTDSLSGQTTWTFEDAGDGTYYILSSNGNYMVMADSSDSTANVSLTTSKDDATKFTVRAINGQAEISYDGPNGIAHYLNVYQGDKDFRGWQDSGTQDSGSKVYLHIAQDSQGNYNLVTNLGGRKFALVSNAQSKAITADTATVNGVPGLKSQNVTITTLNNNRYVSGDIPLWAFEETDTEGVYYISTEVDGAKRYLTLLAQNYAVAADGRGSLSLSDTPQGISVIANDDGTVYLSATVNGYAGYINLDGASYNFWTYNQQHDSDKLLLCEELTEASIFYDLNAPSGTNWIDTPSLSATHQTLTADGTGLLSVQGSNAVGSFVYDTLSAKAHTEVTNYYNTYNTNLGDALTADNYLAPGAEWRFQGWKATVDGVDYLFPEDAAATLGSDGYIHIVDVNGTEQLLPPNTTLTGQWKKISEVIMFFVNFGDTMLETEDNQPIVGYGSNYYTGVVATAHIYNPTTISPGRNADDTKDTILRSNDALIQAEIAAQYDPSVTSTQIVIDAIAEFNADTKQFEFSTVSNFNQVQLEAAVSEYLQKNENNSTQIKIDNAYVDRSEITAENYKLYWYLQKAEANDGWHIDGVLVAKTQPMEIYKTFSGLTDSETATAIDAMTFPLSLIHENTSGTAEKDDYITLTASGSQEGVYTNDGQQGTSHIYKWTLQSIKGQRYAFEETGYAVADHDWSGLISVHYTDGTIEYRYNTDTTFDSSDLFADKPLVGGEVESVIFANFYTKTGTGMFSVSKVQKGNEQNRLSGAVFTLTDSNGNSTSVTTNENGAAHFADLEPGIYTLAETTAPTGYQSVSTKWKVQVTDTDGVITVEIWEADAKTTVYDSGNGGIKAVYLVENAPESTTVTVNKYFKTITEAEISTLKDNYCIEVQDSTGNVVKTLSLSNATAIAGSQNGYTWTIDLTCENKYTFVEKNYSHGNYLDTVVSATVNGTAAAVTKSASNTVASFPMTKSEAADTVNITNDYTNTFLLRIHKVDATNGNADMEGVEFNIYGDFQFHTTPPTGTAATVDYQDADGSTKTAYYIGTTNGTDASGITEFVNMHLSSGSNSFLYVIDEANTPAGYVKLDEPIVRIVEVNGDDPNYSNGVYTLTVENHQEAQATVTVTADKVWAVPDRTDYPAITLNLYKQAADGTVTWIDSVELRGTTQSETTENGITAKIDGWQVVWSGLPYADGSARNEFFVSETPVPGYSTGYSTTVSTLSVGGAQVKAGVAEGLNLKRSVTVTNTTGYELPATGGSGTRQYAPLGLLLMLLSLAAAALPRRSRKAGAAK